MEQGRLARQSNWVVRCWPRSQRVMSWLHAKFYELSSGEKRSTPVLYLSDGNALNVLAANAGANRTPAWWLNLREAGAGNLVIGRTCMRVRSRELAGAERDRAWRAFVEMYPQAEDYPGSPIGNCR